MGKFTRSHVNYKKLRTSLRKRFAKNTANYEDVVARARIIAGQSIDQNLVKALNALITALEDFGTNVQSTVNSSIERTVLIEKQIDRKCFEGELHDSYHAKGQELKTSYHNSVQNAKRLANTLTGLIGTLYSHSEQRGLKFTSFGRFYQSIQSNWATLGQGANGEFLSRVLVFGDATEETVHKYRDNVLEHTDSARPQDNTHLVTQDGRMQIANYRNDPSDKPLPDIVFDANKTNWVYTGITDAEGNAKGEQYTVHVYLRSDLEEGMNIDKGDPLMYVTDMGSGHFGKHGSHIHTFSTPNLEIANAMTGATMPFEMPEIGDLAVTYLKFADAVLDEVEKRLK